MKTFVDGEILTAADLNAALRSLASEIYTATYAASSSANYLNATIPLGHTFTTTPIVWFVNIGSNTLINVRILATAKDSVSVQFQVPSGTLGSFNFRVFAKENDA